MYTSLHNHSTYSVLDGFPQPKEYLEKCSKLGMTAFGITEHGNVYSHLYYAQLQEKYPNIKLLYGVELYECTDINIKNKDDKYYHLVVFAKNEQGRKDLNKIVTKSNMEGFYYKPRVDLNDLKPYGNNLVVCSACLASKLSRESDFNKCVEYVNEYKTIFPYFFLEMQSHTSLDQVEYNKKILKLSQITNTPFVITNDAHVVEESDLQYQAKFIQIARDKETMGEIYEGCYIQTEEEIYSKLSHQIGEDNVRVGLENTNKVVELCDEIKMPFQSPRLPKFPIPDGFNSEIEYFDYLIKEGYYKRGIDKKTQEEREIYNKRIEEEYKVITQMGFVGYFLIVRDYVAYCKKNGLVVGPGRGSAGGSIILYLLEVVELDAIKYGLIFERFLNPEKISFPDIDDDFVDRDAVIRYIGQRYGKEKVCQIINFSYLTPNVAIRDAARVLNIPYSESQKISECFKYETFQEGIDNNPGILQKYSEYKELFTMAEKFTGKIRNVAMHAGGVAVADTDLSEYLACKRGENNEPVISCDKKMVEAIGLVKFDILGVETLQVIQDTLNLGNIDPYEINPNNEKFMTDVESFKTICKLDVDGLFQIEGDGMLSLIRRIQPKSIGELSDIIALFRPDAIPFIEPYIAFKNNGAKPKYIHEDLGKILDKTYGAMIYQETMMEIVKKFSGKSFGRADIFRKIVSKKMKDKVKIEVEKLYHEIIENNYSEQVAKDLCAMLENLGSYSFVKSHAYFYATISLQTAYLKTHYPVEFYCALLNSVQNNNGKLNKYIHSAKEHGIEVLPPHVNRSNADFTLYKSADGNKTSILFGLNAITGLGSKVADSLILAREKGKFTSLEDVLSRVDLSKDQMVALIKSGAIPCKNKKEMLLRYAEMVAPKREFPAYKPVKSLPTQKELKEKWGIDTAVITDREERLSLYNKRKEEYHNRVEYEEFKREIDGKIQTYKNEFATKYMQDEDFWEFETLNIFLKDNPFESIYEYVRPIEEIEDGDRGVIVGIISNITKKIDKKNRQYAHMQVYSAFGIVEVTSWSSDYSKYMNLYAKKNKVAIQYRKDDGHLICCGCKSFKDWYDTDYLLLKNTIDSGAMPIYSKAKF